MTALSGFYYALGTAVDSTRTLTEVAGGSYARPVNALTGSPSGLTETLAQIALAATPASTNIFYGAYFDSLTGGNMIAYWEWAPPFIAVGSAFTSRTINVIFNSYLTAALSLSATGGSGSSGSTIDAGAQIGTLNGAPLIAAMKLQIQGGQLLPATFANTSSTGSQTFPSGSNVVVQGTGVLIEGATTSVAASSTRSQAKATALTTQINRITTTTAPGTGLTLSDGVSLLAAAAGLTLAVENATANPLQVYGAGTDTIANIASATGVTQPPRSTVIYEASTTGSWTNTPLIGTSPNGLPIVLAQDSVTAAGTNQATGAILTGMAATITTSTASTGVNLPASYPGLVVTVSNQGASPIRVYPARSATDTMNGLAATVGILLNSGAIGTFVCTATGVWTATSPDPNATAYNTNSAVTTATLTGANITGGSSLVVLNMTGTMSPGAANVQLPTVAQTLAAMHCAAIGRSWTLRIINTSSANYAWTLVLNGNFTVAGGGTMTILQNCWKDFAITITSLTTATVQNVGMGSAFVL